MIMKGVWPFSPRDFIHMVDGVTRESYKLRDEVEVVRNNINVCLRCIRALLLIADT